MSLKIIAIILAIGSSFLPFIFLIHLPGPFWIGTLIWGVLLVINVVLQKDNKRIVFLLLTAPIALFPKTLYRIIFYIVFSFTSFAP